MGPGSRRDPGCARRREARDRGCRRLLAPTANLHRSPLAGRNSSFIPRTALVRPPGSRVRAGRPIRGRFRHGEHFVGDDAEFERASISSVIDERSLRELCLIPFEPRCAKAEHSPSCGLRPVERALADPAAELLLDVLRDEWGLEGLVMTDWFAVTDTKMSLAAGLDLEMHGPALGLGGPWWRPSRRAMWTRPTSMQPSAGCSAGSIRSGPWRGRRLGLSQSRDVRAMWRCSGAPLPRRRCCSRTAGSSRWRHRPRASRSWCASPDAHHLGGRVGAGHAAPRGERRGRADEHLGPDRALDHERGCEPSQSPTVVGGAVSSGARRLSGRDLCGPRPQWSCDGDRAAQRPPDDEDRLELRASEGDWSMRVSGTMVLEETGIFRLALAQSGLARLLIDDEVVLDGFTNRPHRAATTSSDRPVGTCRRRPFRKGPARRYGRGVASATPALAGFQIGFQTSDSDALLARAVALAATADIAIVCVAPRPSATEGRDRTPWPCPDARPRWSYRSPSTTAPSSWSMRRRRSTWNRRRTLRRADAGSAARNWAGNWWTCWSARRSPGGRLPTTIPIRLEHTPSHANFPGDNGELRYGEGLFIGYRGYEHDATGRARVRPRLELHVVRFWRADVVDGYPPARGDGR